MDDNGNALVVWEGYDAGEFPKIYLSEYRGGSWSHPAAQSDFVTPASGAPTYHEIGMGNGGDALIVYVDDDWGRIQISEFR
ncbi:MAG: hypothetical protein V3S29_04845 [bacterium]